MYMTLFDIIKISLEVGRRGFMALLYVGNWCIVSIDTDYVATAAVVAIIAAAVTAIKARR